jgi:hypothetical protein
MGLGWILLFILVFVSRLARAMSGGGGASVKKYFASYEFIAIAYFIVYAVFILLSATFSRFQALDSRLLSPLYIPWLWGSAGLLSEWAASLSHARRKMILLALVLAGAAFLTGQWLTDRKNWEDQKDSGVPGYTDDDWRGSATMEGLRNNSGGRFSSGLYSNAYDAIWFLGGLRADLLPHKDNRREQSLLLARDSLCVVMFDDGLNPDLIDIAWISRHKKLYSQQPFDDGAIYLFTRKQP